MILMLGTNDLKRRYFQTAPEVAMGIGCLIYDIKELSPGPGGHVPEILVVAPPPMLDDLHEWRAFLKARRKLAQAGAGVRDSGRQQGGAFL